MRRIRATPFAPPRRTGINVGVTLNRSGALRAPGALDTVAAEAAICQTPVSMRWRYYPGYFGDYTSTRDPEIEPPQWPYSFESFPAEAYSSADAPVDFSGQTLGADLIPVPLLESGFPSTLLGYWIIDLIDENGDAVDLRTNYDLACYGPDENENTEVISWAVLFTQFESGGDANIPEMYRRPSGDLVLIVRAAEYIPGTLTISATDSWSPGAPQEFGPLTFTFGEPE